MELNQFNNGARVAESVVRSTERLAQATGSATRSTKTVVCSFIRGFAYGIKHREQRLALPNKN